MGRKCSRPHGRSGGRTSDELAGIRRLFRSPPQCYSRHRRVRRHIESPASNWCIDTPCIGLTGMVFVSLQTRPCTRCRSAETTRRRRLCYVPLLPVTGHCAGIAVIRRKYRVRSRDAARAGNLGVLDFAPENGRGELVRLGRRPRDPSGNRALGGASAARPHCVRACRAGR